MIAEWDDGYRIHHPIPASKEGVAMIRKPHREYLEWDEPNLASTDVIRQHYDPQFYLRAFTNADAKIRAIDLNNQNSIFTTSVANVAVQTQFNDLEVGDVRLSTESWLAEIESEAAPLISRLIGEPDSLFSFSDDEENQLARFITSQWFRVPAFRGWTNAVFERVMSETKDIAFDEFIRRYGQDNAESMWVQWKEQQSTPSSRISASLLSNTQGFSNVLRAMPWRIGWVSKSLLLFTSDNPVARHLNPVRPWWEGGSFSAFTYYMALSPSVLLKIDRLPYEDDSQESIFPGSRQLRNYSDWETSIARHIIANNATRFLYGDAPALTRSCAQSCLKKIDDAAFSTALMQGYDPLPPDWMTSILGWDLDQLKDTDCI